MIDAISPPTETKPYERVGRQAWVILWVAFGLLLIACTGTPLALRWYVQNATTPRFTEARALRGATLVTDPESGAVTAVVDTLVLGEKDLIQTDADARANVSVYARPDGLLSLVNIQLRDNSTLRFERARTPRFRHSSLPERIDLQLLTGAMRVTGNARDQRPLAITIATPHATVFLKDGDDAAITVSDEDTEVSDRNGAIRVEAQGQMVEMSGGQRTTVIAGAPPALPAIGPVNLLVNGDFTQPLESAWQVEALVDARDPSSVEHGAVQIVDSGERKAAYFEREGEEDIHTETAIVQKIDADVLDFDSLTLRLDAMVISQSLAGAGQQSSEFPLMARIDFIDVDGVPRFWTWGFYAKDPVANWPLRDGEKIPAYIWYDYESPDFLNSPTFPRPAKVTSIRIYGSGHNYRSMVSGVGLIAQ